MSDLTFSDWLQAKNYKAEIYNVLFGDVLILWNKNLENSTRPDVKKILDLFKGEQVEITPLVEAMKQRKDSDYVTDSLVLDADKIHIIELKDDTVEAIVAANK